MSFEENRIERQLVLLSCTGCRAMFDERVEPPRWCSAFDYMDCSRTVVHDFVLLESYCPSCDLAYDQLMRYGTTEIPLCP